MPETFNPSEFTVATAKPLPVILLLDTSSSMDGDKIEALNQAVRRMLGTLTKQESQAQEYLVSIITFGTSPSGKPVDLALPPTPAAAVSFTDLQSGGVTPLGQALMVAKELVEDKERTPSRAYRPLAVLVSDGVPTDDEGYPSDNWYSQLDEFVSQGRSAKCDRMSLAIGRDAYEGIGREALDRFTAGTGHEVFEARNAEGILEFFKFVTMSVVTRSLSRDPNTVPQDASLTPPETATPVDDDDSYW